MVESSPSHIAAAQCCRSAFEGGGLPSCASRAGRPLAGARRARRPSPHWRVQAFLNDGWWMGVVSSAKAGTIGVRFEPWPLGEGEWRGWRSGRPAACAIASARGQEASLEAPHRALAVVQAGSCTDRAARVLSVPHGVSVVIAHAVPPPAAARRTLQATSPSTPPTACALRTPTSRAALAWWRRPPLSRRRRRRPLCQPRSRRPACRAQPLRPGRPASVAAPRTSQTG